MISEKKPEWLLELEAALAEDQFGCQRRGYPTSPARSPRTPPSRYPQSSTRDGALLIGQFINSVEATGSFRDTSAAIDLLPPLSSDQKDDLFQGVSVDADDDSPSSTGGGVLDEELKTHVLRQSIQNLKV